MEARAAAASVSAPQAPSQAGGRIDPLPETEHLIELHELAGDVVTEVAPEIAAAAAVATMCLNRRKRVSPLGTWIRGFFAGEEWEALIGGRLLNRVGAIALTLGMGLFLKYAIDQDWLGQGARVGVGVAVGTALLGLSTRSHRRGYAIFGQGLVGAGQAVLYLSVFASYNFYHLVPQPAALAAMGAVAALGFVQGVSYDSLAVSLLACFGGYLAPFLLVSSGSGPLGTVAYLLVLNAGVLAVLVRRPWWAVLEPIAMGATYTAYFVWFVTGYEQRQLPLAAAALTLFWALFLAHELRALAGGAAHPPAMRHALGAANATAYLAGLFALLDAAHPVILGAWAVTLGVLYAVVLIVSRSRGWLPAGTEARYGLSAIVLLVVATAVPLRGFPVAILWTLEALPLLFAGVRYNRRYLWQPAVGMYALALTLLVATPGALAYSPISEFRPVLNLRDLAYLVLIGAIAAGSLPARRLPAWVGEPLWQSFQYAWTGLSLILLAVETNDVFLRLAMGIHEGARAGLLFERSLTIGLVWMAFSVILGSYAWRKQVLPCAAVALVSAGLAVGLTMAAGATFEPIDAFVPIVNLRVAAFVLIAGGLAVHLRRLGRESQSWDLGIRVTVQIAMLMMGFELVMAEVNDFFMRRAGHSLMNMDAGGVFIELAVLAGLWALYSLLPTWFGVKQGTMPLVVLGLSMTAAATGVSALGGIAFQPSHALALALGVRPVILVVLVAGLLLQLRWVRTGTRGKRWHAGVVIGLQAAVILLGFGLISAETRDVFARAIAGGTAQHVSTLQNLERLAFSLVWLAYAIGLMGIGIWRRARWMRLGAMALLGAVILKVFIYDLSFLGTVYRPVSFAGLGAVLLLVSFLYGKYRGLLIRNTVS
jgi:uncharacterized membrane protein